MHYPLGSYKVLRKLHVSDVSSDQENPADARTYKYSQLLFSMVGFTIVNLWEVHLNIKVRLMPHCVSSMFLRTSLTLRKSRTAQQFFERKTGKPAKVAEWPRG